MTTLDSNTIRVRIDVLSFDAPVDDVRKQLIQFWRCNDLRFRIGIFHGSELIDVSNFATLHLSVRPLDDGNPPSGGSASLMLGSTSTFDTTVTAETWATSVNQHAEIIFSAADNALEAGEYWISFWATTETEHTVTLGSGVCKVLENGGISLTPPEPKENYYTAEECDEKFAPIDSGSGDGGGNVDLSDYYTKTETYSQSEIDDTLEDYYTKTETDNALEDYYTAEECDEKFAPIDGGSGEGGSNVDLSDYYTKTETYSQSEIDDTLEDYYTKTETDNALEDYYTAEECDEKFAPIDGGSGGSSGDGLVPENKGEIVIGNGSGATLLAVGQNQQLLVANPNATLGAEWRNYPWQLLQEISITNSVAEIIFENAFNAELFWHYKLCYSFITTSVVAERILMVFGYDNEGTTTWATSASEYTYNTNEFSGNLVKYTTFQFVDGFFALGSDSITYRNNGGWMHGEMDFWNDGNIAHRVQARAYSNVYRIYNDVFIAGGGIYNFIYKNVGEKVIRSLKIYVANGTLTSGRFTLYGIH